MAKAAPAKKAPAKKPASKAAAPQKAAPAKKAAPKAVAKKADAKKPAAKKVVAKKAPAKKSPAKAPAAKKAPAKKAPAKSAPKPKAPAKKVEAKKVAPKKEAPPKKVEAKKVAPKKEAPPKKPPKPVVLKSPYDAKFLDEQRRSLLDERAQLLGSAERLEGEAAALMEDLDPGDVQFDDESGEGDTLVVERERDLALSSQARQMIADIDAAIRRLDSGVYGLSTISSRPIPKERLRAIPWATELVEEKVGGLGRR
jgi:RNA polymerase-binding transcription factor DksA